MYSYKNVDSSQFPVEIFFTVNRLTVNRNPFLQHEGGMLATKKRIYTDKGKQGQGRT